MKDKIYDMSRVNDSRILEGTTMLVKNINLISCDILKNFVLECLDMAPDYFWVIPASITMKYHPEWAKWDNGLVKHTVLAMYLGKELSQTYELSLTQTDIVLAALALHDTLKYGIDFDVRYSKMHQYLPREYYKEVIKKYKDDAIISPFSEGSYAEIFDAIERHMGSLSSGAWTSVGGLKPETPVQQVVHLADYIASRSEISASFIDYDF